MFTDVSAEDFSPTSLAITFLKKTSQQLVAEDTRAFSFIICDFVPSVRFITGRNSVPVWLEATPVEGGLGLVRETL